MALGGTVGMFGQVLNAGKGLFSKILPWAAGGTVAEVVTNDGDGGLITDAWRKGSQSLATETSSTQAVDQLFDMVSGANNGVVTFFSGTLASLCQVIYDLSGGKLGFFGDWAQNLRSLEQTSGQRVINERAQQARLNGQQGLDNDTPPAGTEGPTGNDNTLVNQTMNGIESVVPDSLDGGDATKATIGAAAVTGAGLWGLSKFFGGNKAAATTAVNATDDVARAAMKGPWWSKLLGAAVLATTGTIALNATAAEDAHTPEEPVALEDGTLVDPANPPEGSVVRMGVDENGAPIAIVEEKVDLFANPQGWFNDFGQDLSKMVEARPDGLEGNQVNWEGVGEVSADVGKSAWFGLNTTTGWLAGGALDLVNLGDNFFAINVIPDGEKSYADQAAGYMADSFNRVSDAYLGGAPDMNSALNQTAAFGGGMLAGVPVTKGAQVLTQGFTKLAAGISTDVAVTSGASNTVTLGQGPALNALTP